MRYLVDTHIFVWRHVQSERLPPRLAELLRRSDLEIVVSMATPWEIAVKAALGKPLLPRPVMRSFEAILNASGYGLLPITLDHLALVATLPHHHGDPFDRLIVAQALAEDLTVVTIDRKLEAYGVRLAPA